jgi:hypothetical protein
MYLLSSAELFSELAGAAGAEAGAAAGAAATGAATIGAAWYITGSDWLPLMEMRKPSLSISTLPSPDLDTNLIRSLISSKFMV